MSDNKGFSFIEVLISAFMLITLITTVLPIVTTIDKSQEALKDKRELSMQLHDFLQRYLWEPNVALPDTKTVQHKNQLVTYQFMMDSGLIKGCVSFENIRTRKEETICLYGYR